MLLNKNGWRSFCVLCMTSLQYQHFQNVFWTCMPIFKKQKKNKKRLFTVLYHQWTLLFSDWQTFGLSSHVKAVIFAFVFWTLQGSDKVESLLKLIHFGGKNGCFCCWSMFKSTHTHTRKKILRNRWENWERFVLISRIDNGIGIDKILSIPTPHLTSGTASPL